MDALNKRKYEVIQALTKREYEIMDLVKEGLTNREIGVLLYISVNTVRSHLYVTFRKLHVQNRTHAARIYDEFRLTG